VRRREPGLTSAMTHGQISVAQISTGSPLFEQVVALGNANSRTLGFFPKGAFVDAAVESRLLAALNADKELAGYVLYRTAGQRAMVVRLCVDTPYRRRGITKVLVNELVGRVRHLDGLGLWCRNDYAENALWPKLGFQFVRERPGRSLHGHPLSLWWMDFGHQNLFSLASSGPEQTVDVVFDMSVIALIDEEGAPPEIRALSADWLQNSLRAFVTPEARVEVDRDSDVVRRRRSITKLQGFEPLHASMADFDRAIPGMAGLVCPNVDYESLSANDQSDIRHLAYAVTTGEPFFVTRDDRLLRRRKQIAERYPLTLLRPAELVLHLERSANKLSQHLPFPDRRLRIVPAAATDLDDAVVAFLDTEHGERRVHFEKAFLQAALTPEVNEIQLVKDGDQCVAILVVDMSDAHVARVPLFRIARGTQSAIVARHLLGVLALRTAAAGRILTNVSDPHLTPAAASFMAEFGYFEQDNSIWKCGSLGAVTVDEICSRLGTDMLPSDACRTAEKILAELKATENSSFPSSARLERTLWPARVLGVGIPSYVIPIQPSWARELFDSRLAAQGLFEPEQALVLNPQNVYYRSARGGNPPPGARLIWYVSGQYGGTEIKAARACSTCDEVVIDSAARVYKSYKRLGVYSWQNLTRMAKGTSRKVAAIRFGRTHEFDSPVTLPVLRSLYSSATGKTLSVQGPMQIPESMLRSIVQEGVTSVGSRAAGY
jgi:ribosomal protein S18 acetylase RimI-like enzyme/predicted nucleic acid-binding protein